MPQRRAVVAGSRTFPGAGLAPEPGSLIAQIEGIFESIVESIIRKEELTINFVATSKGLVAGQATVHLKDGTSIDASYNRIGSSIPLSTTIASVNTSNIKWILVIEKDAVFRSLVSTEFWRTSAAGLGLLVTVECHSRKLRQR
ncbi:unnamed protein product [Clonostachys rosea f. rosea IK726]|uniref:Uncharacterized protein n=1 Tax=Clonostachys rosea f. rosea IK726 TaxID=1349383 RepID=A0ACA9UEF9_BIOOC|nr:unnamed protein product [Clonostachys rosea f. rosea IK726]